MIVARLLLVSMINPSEPLWLAYGLLAKNSLQIFPDNPPAISRSRGAAFRSLVGTTFVGAIFVGATFVGATFVGAIFLHRTTL